MTNTKAYLRTLALGLMMGAVSSGILQAQVALDPAWRVTPDTTKPGFQWRYFQNDLNRPNTDSRTETALAGQLTDGTGALLPNLGDPDAVGAASTNAAPANPANGSLYFEITNVINLSKTDGGADGYFPDSQLEPGTSITPNTDGQNAEVLTFLTLPAGTNYMSVNSDDSSKVQSGPNPQDVFGRVTLAVRDGGAGEMKFSFVVPPGGAGTYPFRMIWANGGGGSHVEWFTTDPDGVSNRRLINDVANGGIPAYLAAVGAVTPYVQATSPFAVPRQTEAASRSVTVVLGDGTTPVNTNNITLSVDGTPATLTVSKIGTLVTVDTGVIPGMHLPAEGHTAVLTYHDTGTYSRTQQWTFYNLENLLLPASPVTGENFDSYPEATSPATTVPPGWTVTNYTWLEVEPPAGFGTWDLTDVANDPFVDWVMLTTATVLPLEPEVLDNYKAQTINGIPLTNADSWMSNNLIFAASDGRARRVSIGGVDEPNDYAPQIQITVSAAFNLSSVTNPVLTFSSASRLSPNHEQNSLEYSVDNGATWLPALILQNSTTHFLNTDGSYDGVKMLTNAWADVAKFPVVQDPSTRDFISAGPLGQKFGDVLKTPISPALSPYVVERNDGAQSRKVEAIRLPAASQKSQVRLRFIHYGSCGWEWGIDNIAFYDIAPLVTTNPNWPSELGQTVNGFQDDFTGATRDPNWKPFGPGGDFYVQANGLMHVSVRSGDPNHLLYVVPGYNPTNQEVVARIRVTAFGATNDASRAGIGVGVQTNAAALSQGINLHFRDYTQDLVPGRQFKLLDDARAWGPAGLPTTWVNNTWYWLRLRQEPNAAGGTNDVFGKVWPSDGVTPEPTNWQLIWNYIPIRTVRSGYAGITGSSINGIGNFEVDYILIKAEGLPSITVNFDKSGPAVTVPQFYLTQLTTNRVRFGWFGAGALESATNVLGSWATVSGAASPLTVTNPATTANTFYRIKN